MEAETGESLEAFGPAILTWAAMSKRLPQTGWQARTNTWCCPLTSLNMAVVHAWTHARMHFWRFCVPLWLPTTGKHKHRLLNSLQQGEDKWEQRCHSLCFSFNVIGNKQNGTRKTTRWQQQSPWRAVGFKTKCFKEVNIFSFSFLCSPL